MASATGIHQLQTGTSPRTVRPVSSHVRAFVTLCYSTYKVLRPFCNDSTYTKLSFVHFIT